jgi:hypothetical protein
MIQPDRMLDDLDRVSEAAIRVGRGCHARQIVTALPRRQPDKALYGVRAGIEGRLSQAIRRCGLRRSRYVGLAKTRLQHVATAAALNVVRLDAWLRSRPRAATRRSRLVRLLAA